MAFSQQNHIFQAIITIPGPSCLIINVMSTLKNVNLASLFRLFWTKIVRGIGTKYVIVLAIAIVWMVFFDRYNIPAQMNMSSQIQQEKQNEQWYLTANEGLDAQRVRLETNEEELERIAREKFLMKKRNEVVYLIKDEAAQP